MDFLERLKMLCDEKGVSQRKLEQDLRLSNGSTSKWKNSSPSGDVLRKISEYFNVSIDYLMGKDDVKSELSPKSEQEKKLIVLFRETNGVSDSDKEMLVKQFESTIDMYLKAKGIKKE